MAFTWPNLSFGS